MLPRAVVDFARDELVLRVPVEREDFAPAAALRPALAADVRLAAEPADLARVDVALRPPVEPVLLLRPPVLLLVPALLRDVPDLADEARDPPELDREELERPLEDLAALVPLREDPLPDELEPSSPVHLPDITRCAASATASAMIAPSLFALDTMLLAACDAVSAASSPASRILRRAAGLALIAAAAAARPAASISLLIAAFASLSTVSFDLLEEPEELFDELFLADFAMGVSLRCAEKTPESRNGSLMMADMRHECASRCAEPCVVRTC